MKKYKSLLLNLGFLILGIFLLWLAFRKQDPAALLDKIGELDYRWALLVLGISLLNQIIRALRWKLLTDAIGLHIPAPRLFWALVFGFMVNLGIPRLGEISRCLILSRKDGAPFAPLLGTVVSERALDVLSLILILIAVIASQFNLLYSFFQDSVALPLLAILMARQWLLYSLMFLGLLSLIILAWNWKRLTRSPLGGKITQFIEKIIQGISSVARIKPIALFLFYTFLIWFTYFLMTYLWFFSLPGTQHLGVREALGLLAIGSLARLAPTQGGGLGAYQLLVTEGMQLYGVSALTGGALALVIHGAQIVFTLLFGALAFVVFAYIPSRPVELDPASK